MDRKLDISAISFDDMLGDGLQSVESTEEAVDTIEANEIPDVKSEEVADNDDNLEPNNEIDYEDDVEVDEPESDESNNIVSEIASTLGFELEGEYEETVDGITNFVRDISQKAAEDQLQGLFEQYPEVQKHLDFLMAGGNSSEFLQTYNPQTDFGAIEMEETDVNIQRAVLGQFFYNKGHDQEFINDMLDTLEDKTFIFDSLYLPRDI